MGPVWFEIEPNSNRFGSLSFEFDIFIFNQNISVYEREHNRKIHPYRISNRKMIQSAYGHPYRTIVSDVTYAMEIHIDH